MACSRPAAATLSYAYVSSTAVLGPLAVDVEPHSYDLCLEHAERLTAPRGWELQRRPIEPLLVPPPRPEELAALDGTSALDDLGALADAVRESTEVPSRPAPVRRGHLRSVPSGG